jgi:diaminopimelate decarboxylase
MTNRLLRISLATALLAALAGCGNKGPLVHPQSPADEMPVPATSALPGNATMAVPASTAPAAPADVLPAPATTVPATPAEPAPPPANGGG